MRATQDLPSASGERASLLPLQRMILADVGAAASALTTAYGIWILPPPPRPPGGNPAPPWPGSTSDDAA